MTLHRAFTIHCSASSTHSFHFGSQASILTEHVTDPNSGNQSASTTLTVNAWGQADIAVADLALVGLPLEIALSQDVPVTLAAVLHNSGPSTPVMAQYQLGLVAPAGCTIDSAASKTKNEQVELPVSVDVPVSMTATVHCAEASSHTFNFSGQVNVTGDPHITDPNAGNNTASGQATTAVVASADVKISSWTVADALPWRPGIQVLMGPLSPLGSELITADEVLHNNGPYGPVPVAINQTATSLAPAVCSITPASANSSTTLAVGVPFSDSTDFTVSWLDDPKPPFTCDVELAKTVTIDALHVVDTNGASATLAIEVVRDSKHMTLSATIGDRETYLASRPASDDGDFRALDWMGMQLMSFTPEVARALGVEFVEGVFVRRVYSGSPADRASIVKGTVILQVNKQTTQSLDEITAVARQLEGRSERIALIVQEPDGTVARKVIRQ